MRLLKKIWCNMMCYAEAMGNARAAATLSAHGLHKEAKDLMLSKRECKCC